MAGRAVPEIVANPENFVRGVDVNNVSGKRKAELIETGDMTIDNFINPPNMPGKKLEELRKAHRERVEGASKEVAKNKGPNPYKVGDHISYKGKVYEVLKIDDFKVGFDLMRNGETRSVLVPHFKLKKG